MMQNVKRTLMDQPVMAIRYCEIESRWKVYYYAI